MQQRRKPGPKPSVTLVEAMCDECGNIRTAKDTYLGRSGCPRSLRCDACNRATYHVRLTTEFGDDWRENNNTRQNHKNAVQFAQLHVSIDLLERLGVRFERVETTEWYAVVWRERGRGSEAAFIWLAEDLTLADQVKYLDWAWGTLLPAANAHWLKPWYQDPDDPEMENCAVYRPRLNRPDDREEL